MNKFLALCLIGSIFSFGSSSYNGSTTGAVCLVGGIIKAQHGDTIEKKYKRKDCPVCKGKGYYISGDGISKVECGYCESDKKASEPQLSLSGTCKTQVIKK